MGRKEWILAEVNKAWVEEIAAAQDIHPFMARLLAGRGICQPEELEDFFGMSSMPLDPFLFKDMDKAAAGLLEAISKGERIAVYGDYDADGVTATAIITDYLTTLSADVFYDIPERATDGYGLSREAVDRLAEKGAKWILTVDNGIAAVDEAVYIAEKGINLLITDHHRPGESLPQAAALVDPYRADCPSPFKGLSGAGLALKLVQAMELLRSEETDLEFLADEYTDLATIGILADVSPVLGENRLIIRKGLARLNQTARPGLQALLRAAGVENQLLDATGVLFRLIPRINAAGRIGKADRMARLLLTEDVGEAEEIAREVDGENQLRRELEEAILKEIDTALAANPAWLCRRVLVFKGKSWWTGVLGITAARLCERYGKPCVILSEEGGELVGSCRSIEGFSIFEALSHCRDLLIRFGGHTLAAGVTLKSEQFEQFAGQLEDYAREVCPVMPYPKLRIDCKLPPSSLRIELARMLADLEPCGTGNPPPLFGLFGCEIDSIIPLKEGRHVRINLRRDGKVIPAVWFGMARGSLPYEKGDTVDAAISLSEGEYRGQPQLTVLIRDMRLSAVDHTARLREQRLFERLEMGEDVSAEVADDHCPNREDIAIVYRYLMAAKEFVGDLEVLHFRLQKNDMCYLKFCISLLALIQTGLVQRTEAAGQAKIILTQNPEKVDIQTADVLRRLRMA